VPTQFVTRLKPALDALNNTAAELYPRMPKTRMFANNPFLRDPSGGAMIS
jgi:hypothetical protein